MLQRLICPKCSTPLVHDFCEVYNRCLGCGWYEARLTQLAGFVKDDDLSKGTVPGYADNPARIFADGLDAATDGRGFGKPHLEVRNLIEASVVALSALQKNLEYIGDDNGSCPVCGGDVDDPDGNGLPYLGSCPCFLTRKALKMIKEGSTDV